MVGIFGGIVLISGWVIVVIKGGGKIKVFFFLGMFSICKCLFFSFVILLNIEVRGWNLGF